MLHYYKLFEIIKVDENNEKVFFNIVDNEIIKVLRKVKTSEFKKVFDFENNRSYIITDKRNLPKCTCCNQNKVAEYVEIFDEFATYLCRSCFDYTRGDLTEEEMLEL